MEYIRIKECIEAFEKSKRRLTTNQLLAIPDGFEEMKINTNGSGWRLECALG